jgi:hypothetical protein
MRNFKALGNPLLGERKREDKLELSCAKLRIN